MKSYAQAAQDLWVHSIIGDSGYFVDVGAHDGIIHSNTYALEQLGWTGLCIEPNAQASHELCTNRTAFVRWFAVSDHHGVVPFDGIMVGAGPMVECWTLTEALEDVGAPTTIDYLSIDVEGHELEVLAGMDFQRWHVRAATIEHNAYCDGPARRDAIAAVMVANGFECYADDVVAPGYGEYESWWIHRDH